MQKNTTKQILTIFIAVLLVGIVGFLVGGDTTGDAFGRRWGGSSSWGGGGSPFSSYNPPPYTPTQQPVQQPQQQAQQPQMSQQALTATLTNVLNNYLNSQRDKNICLAYCASTLNGYCSSYARNMPAGTNCNTITGPLIANCVNGCNAKFPARPTINPDQWATNFVNSIVNTAQNEAICKSNCVQALQGNCNNLKAQNYFPPETDCNNLVSRYAQSCVQRCEAKFPPQVASSWGLTTPQQPRPPTQQQAPAAPVQQAKPTTQQCTTNCENNAALMYKQCMDQGAGEAACQNVGNLYKANCIKKCYGY